MRLSVALVLLTLAPAPLAAEVTVRVSEGHVDLTAKAAPLGDVLDRLARQTGMKVVYEGPAPRNLVTLSIQGRTPAEAVLSVLEGSGINFALVGDATGAGVQTLVVAGAATASTAPSAATPSSPAVPSRRTFGMPPGSSPDTVDPAFDEEEGDALEEPGLPPGVPPGVEMGDPAVVGAPPGAPPQDAARQPGGPPAVPPALPGFSASPFTPQPQPFPRVVPSPTTPGPANPNPEENPASAVPPPS